MTFADPDAEGRVLPLAAESELSLSEFAYAQVLDLILSGRLQAGAVLQERKLADMLSISRTPVREALGRLETESLAMRRQGRMLVVADVSIETYMNLLDMRRILEVEVAARATSQLAADDAERVRGAIRWLLQLPKITPADHWSVDDLVHGTIAEAAGNPMVAAAIRDLRRRTHIFNTARMPHRLQPGGSEHMALIDAVAGGDAELSRRLMGKHLDNVRDAIIDFILGRRRG
ncbi:DNA-binding GntR family transcriptional regulator [Rhizobium sp. BK529]|uniref:GntR family transcriptional regulator n=1 Tax=Rhizobium sp. BK529 TaxID=2586983 RepID=UPI00160E63C1|nr:GntR family transcriptional regulator [Rhizobium sp. BK529]MBB3594891.1 DNA-binding GntR family transcriptional regulator [Rhizobium sp. BK529]